MNTGVERFESAIEQTIETIDARVGAAERTIAQRFGLRALGALRLAIKTSVWALLVAAFALALAMLAFRYLLLPNLDGWRARIEAIASDALQAPVSIDRISGGWRAFNPHFSLTNVRIAGPRTSETLTLPRVDATLSWRSVLALEPRFASISILAPELDITRLSSDRFSIAGFIVESSAAGDRSSESKAAEWILAQERVVIRDARVRFSDHSTSERRELQLTDVDLLLERNFGSHRFSLQAAPTASVAAPIDIRGRFRSPLGARASDIRQWRGEVFSQLAFADLAALARLIDAPLEIRHAHGALRGWLTFDRMQVERVAADLALQDVEVRLASDLEPLKLASLQGRLSQHTVAGGDRAADVFGLQHLTFTTEAGTFGPLDMTVRRWPATPAEPERIALQADRVDLTTLAALAAHVPLARELRDSLGRHAIRGLVTDLTMQWDGPPEPATITLKARFAGLASAAQPSTPVPTPGSKPKPGLPGFENLSGSIDIARGSGTVQLASTNGALIFPGVFAEPRIGFDDLAATLRLRWQPQLEVRVESAKIAAVDAEATASGWYRATDNGPGLLDLTGRLIRGDATAAYRYTPLIAGKSTLHWLQHALIAGRLHDGSFRIQGDLRRFPFRDGGGEFRVAGRVSGGVLDVLPLRAGADGRQPPPGSVWPLLSGIDAQLLFERASMTVIAQRADAMGARIGATVATIADLDHDATLQVRGQAAGPLAEMLRYANASPVVRWTGGITRAEAAGPARLELQLQVPLQHADDTQVAGTVHLLNNDLVIKDVPPLGSATGAVHFNERGVQIQGVTASLVGGSARIDASTQDDGTMLFTASGTATPAGIQRAIALGPVNRFLERAQGSARYQGRLTVQRGSTALTIDSDLVGLAVDGIAPLRKTANESMPLSIALTPTTSGRDQLRVSAGSALTVQIERERREAGARIVRGVIAINDQPVVPDEGLLLLAGGPRFDADAWATLLGAGAEENRGDAGWTLDKVALRTGELIVYGRTFRDVTLGASRVAGGGYDANVISDQAVGFISWRPPAGNTQDSLGQIDARLAKLTISRQHKQQLVDALRTPPKQIPALRVKVDQFELSEMKLGQLDLVASNVGSGASALWRVHRLQISNPDVRIEANGEWSPATVAAGARRRTRLNFTAEAGDAGASLARFGYPATMAGGYGKLQGEIAWLGSPFDLDLPTLSGTLQLHVDQGRFLKIDAGNAGRLLTLFSLQSLSRTLALDGGRQFADGFAFTAMRADATIARGVLSTENFHMNGSNAVVLISGTIDLRDETQRLHVAVIPEIDASTAALAVGVANPILGLGTFLAQWVLRDPLSKAFALEYDISGQWAEPVVKRRPRIAAPAAEFLK